MKNIKFKSVAIISVVALLVIGFCTWQNNDIVITNYVYKSSRIEDDLSGYKIAQISDLHNKTFGKDQKKLLNKLLGVKPDLIVITGDIIDSNHTDINMALRFIKGAVEIAPVYYVTGNHEFWVEDQARDTLIKGMEQYGVTMLDNRVVNMSGVGDKGFYLVGLGDNNLADNTLKHLNTQLDRSKLRIVLAHEPQYMEYYRDAGADLVLSGHAHGGQFRLPFVGGLVAPDQGFFPKYTSGMYVNGSTTMIVSRGLGNSIIPVRIFNRPEIVTITLQNYEG
jgi:predicted MPP superfamily phosphohydrolase